jgi:pimeloyl-ACP methyl ester carboxylesterase
LMASDVLAVIDALQIEQAAFVGWSDGAVIALILAAQTPARVDGVFFLLATWTSVAQRNSNSALLSSAALLGT